MISRAKRLELFDFYVLEKRCPICKDWRRSERPRRREEIDVVPIKGGICARCVMAFVKNICTLRKKTKPCKKLAARNEAEACIGCLPKFFETLGAKRRRSASGDCQPPTQH
jgi:hypothetical protein